MPESLRAIDANVVLRYLINDIPEQAERARRLIESGQPLALTAVTLAELAWTLTGPRYAHDRVEVANLLGQFVARDNVTVIGCEKVEAQEALRACARPIGAAHFGDAFIAACARSFGVAEIFSFDQRFGRADLAAIAPQ
jgi:predicted nucleic acid-binding protein